jgi:uroporphyrinogen-III synthase
VSAPPTPPLAALVTRPTAQAAEWVDRLRQRGIDAHALPLLAITPRINDPALTASWDELPRYALVMFVSPNAVKSFFAVKPVQAAWPAALRAAATGPGSVEALIDAGVPRERCIAPTRPPFDSSALWALLRDDDWKGKHVLVVRGNGGRVEFTVALLGAGAHISFVQAYTRDLPQWSTTERATAAAARLAPARHVWLLTSAEAMGHLTTLLPGMDWAQALAVTTHPRIADAARQLGFGRVVESSPQVKDVVASIRYLARAAP